MEQFRKEFAAAAKNNKELGVGAAEGGDDDETDGCVSSLSFALSPSVQRNAGKP